MILAFNGLFVLSQEPLSASSRTPTADEISQRMVISSEARAKSLVTYSAVRHYTVSYHGFPAPLNAAMEVEVAYLAPATKHFQILSHSGSPLLFDEVLKKLLTSEAEASRHPAETALSPENYRFAVLGQEKLINRNCYVLNVEPKTDSKFLYRGKIWVDAEDFAVAQIEAQPAKNPSFWIKDTIVHHVYKKTSLFWLPSSNRSETVMRFGGTAILTIDYGTYKIEMLGLVR